MANTKNFRKVLTLLLLFCCCHLNAFGFTYSTNFPQLSEEVKNTINKQSSNQEFNLPSPSSKSVNKQSQPEKETTSSKFTSVPKLETEYQEERITSPSAIEKAYRLQYGKILLNQIINLDCYTQYITKEVPGFVDMFKSPSMPDYSKRVNQPQYKQYNDINNEKHYQVPSFQSNIYSSTNEESRTSYPDNTNNYISNYQLHYPYPSHPTEQQSFSSQQKTYGNQSLYRDNKNNYLFGYNQANAYHVQFKQKEEPIDLEKIINSQLTQFGYDIFNKDQFAPLDNIVPDKNYILAPGDIIKIRIWGSNIDTELSGKIENDGTIFFPKIGTLHLAGVKYKNLDQILSKEVKKYLPGVKIDSVIEQLHSIQVYVVGQVNEPGLKVMPAFSTVFTALALSNGIAKSGSLRNVYIYRENKLYKKLDIYDLITNGSKKNDIVLQDRDLIYVPYIGPTVAIVGAVVKPGIFELPPDSTGSSKTIKTLLNLAGGPLHQAHSRLYIRHFKDHQTLEIKEISLAQINKSSVVPQNGDLIELRYVNPGLTSAVKLKGHVWQELEKDYKKGLKLSQLLNNPENIKPGAITDFAIIKRYIPLASDYTTIRFPLQKVLQGQFDMELHPYDEIHILAKKDFNIRQPVFITGAVWQPGEYQAEPGLTVSALIAQAGGVKYGANIHHIELSRQYILQNHIETRHQIIDIKKTDISLQPYDTIHVPLLNQAGEIHQVCIKGEVRYPGIYTIKDGEHLSDLIQRAGGFTDKAYFYGAKYTTLRAREIQQKSIDHLIQDLQIRAQQVLSEQAQTAVSKEDAEAAKAAQSSIQALINRLKTVKAEGRVSIFLTDLKSFKGSKYDFELGDGDTLEIPKRPNFIAVVGSVYSPGAFLYEPNKPLEFYLQKSGGPTKTADEDYVYVLKANGEVISKVQKSGLFTRFYSMKLMPGDTIVVPENLERIPYLRLVKDITDIVFKIATTAGIALAIF